MKNFLPATWVGIAAAVGLSACSAMQAAPDAGASTTAENTQRVTVPQFVLPPPRQTAPAGAKGQPYQFADAVAVKIRPSLNGQWSAWDENNDRWRLDLVSRGARSLNLHFDRFVLPQGAILRLYDPRRPRGGVQLNAADNKPHGAYWSPQISGDTLRLDLILPRSYAQKIELSIADVNVAW